MPDQPMKILFREDEHMLQYKKRQFNLTNNDVAMMLGITSEALFMASLGRPVPEDTYNAIKEWIHE